ncbi:MAG: hypothetical protein RLZZ480_77 [Candidatus Parcubacteria bacterium]
MQYMKHSLALLVLVLFAVPFYVSASDIEITPLLIDVDVEARDIITKEVTLVNTTNEKKILYATVNEVAVDTTGEVKEFISPSMDDRTTAITSWIEVSRGRIELEPGETEIIPVTIRVNPYAKTGDYHGFVGFVPTTKQYIADQTALAGNADGVIVKVSLQEKLAGTLRINSFLIDRFILNSDQRSAQVELKNDGEVPLVPKGEIIFYNSRGEEVASVPINEAGEEVAPGAFKTFTAPIPFRQELGRFKANVRLKYGADNEAFIFDTTQFFMIPPYLAVVMVIGIIVFSVLVTYLIRRAFYDELHEDDDGNTVPLYVRNDREHNIKDHDIHLTK